MESSPKEKFEAAVKVIQTLPKNGSFQPSHALMLRLYAYYKQATQGKCDIPRPAFWDVIGKAKWDAWDKLGDMPSEAAMNSYVEELKTVIEAMPHTSMVGEFVSKLGNFYELVDEKKGEDYKKLKPLLNGGVKTGSEDDSSSSDGSPKRTFDNSLDAGADLGVELPADSEATEEIIVMPVNLKRGPPMDHSPHTNGNHYMESDEDQENGDDNMVNGNGEPLVNTSSTTDPLGSSDDTTDPLVSDEDSEGDEFCDTTDSPTVQWQGLNGDPEEDDPDETLPKELYTPQRDHQYSLPTNSGSTPAFPRDTSSATLSLGPQQLLDRDWSTANLATMDSQNEALSMAAMSQEIAAMVTRGGGEMGEIATNPGTSSLPNRGSSGNVSRQGRGGAIPRSTGSQRGQLLTGGGGAGGGSGGQGSSTAGRSTDVSDQIAVALLRLQNDMSSVLSRLDTLESLALNQNEGVSSASSSTRRRQNRVSWWWPFPNGLPSRTIFFLFVWPIIVHWFLTAWRRRNRTQQR